MPEWPSDRAHKLRDLAEKTQRDSYTLDTACNILEGYENGEAFELKIGNGVLKMPEDFYFDMLMYLVTWANAIAKEYGCE